MVMRAIACGSQYTISSPGSVPERAACHVVSTATEYGAPGEIVWMQTGHANSPAARRYVELFSPVLLYRTWEAFQL